MSATERFVLAPLWVLGVVIASKIPNKIVADLMAIPLTLGIYLWFMYMWQRSEEA